MPTIGIVDDREDVRITITDRIRLALPEGWDALDIPPFKSLDDYLIWVSQYEIVALIIDEQLNEVSNQGVAVNYAGHDLVDYIRQHLPEFPIFVVTSYKNDPVLQEELEGRFKYVEDIIERNAFYERPDDYIARITRAGQRYSQTFEGELAELADFAKKVATGESISIEERGRAKAIQTKLETAFPVDSISTRGEWLSRMEQLIEELEVLKMDIKKQIGEQS